MIRPKWLGYYGYVFFQSATVVATGDSGIIATPLVVSGGEAIFPNSFLAVGTNMLTDETNVLTIDWYIEAAGTAGAIGTTTFTILNAANLTRIEAWPGDVTAFNAARDLVPLFPFCKITHTLAGTTKSMEYTIYMNYLKFTG